MTGLTEFVERRFPGWQMEPLSDTNNTIVRISDGTASLAVKEVTDADIPVCYTIEASLALELHTRVQRVIELVYRRNAPAIVVSEYLEGRPLSDVIGDTSNPVAANRFVEYFGGFIEACADLPRLWPGFGLYKVEAPRFDRLDRFLQFYAGKYWRRIRPVLDRSDSVVWVDNWLATGLAAAFAGEPYRTVAIDANLRNFVELDTGEICLLNVPIVSVSTRAHAVAALAVHLRYTPIFDAFITKALDTFSAEERLASMHLEVWQLLGIMSFYAARNPDTPGNWRNWGSPVPLMVHLEQLISMLRNEEFGQSSLVKL